MPIPIIILIAVVVCFFIFKTIRHRNKYEETEPANKIIQKKENNTNIEKEFVERRPWSYYLFIIFLLMIVIQMAGCVIMIIGSVFGQSSVQKNSTSNNQDRPTTQIISLTEDFSKAYARRDDQGYYLHAELVEPVDGYYLYSDQNGRIYKEGYGQNAIYDPSKISWLKFKKQGKHEVKIRIWYE